MSTNNYGVTATATPPTPPPPPPIETVTLTMPYGVALTLARLLAKVSGDVDASFRAHTNAINVALGNSGVNWYDAGDRFIAPQIDALPLKRRA